MPEVLTMDVVKQQLQALPGWRIAGGKRKRIQRRLAFRDFVQALRFVNKVGKQAEAQGHHPDITIRYNKVTLDLVTHSAGGLTDLDFLLATAIDELARPGGDDTAALARPWWR